MCANVKNVKVKLIKFGKVVKRLVKDFGRKVVEYCKDFKSS